MPISSIEKLRIKEYLLNSLDDEQETEKIELRLLSDDDYALEFEICEEELINDYAAEKLNSAEKILFEKNYLISQTRREKLDFAFAWRKISETDKPTVRKNVAPISQKPNLFEKFFLFSRPAVLAGIILLFGGGIFLVWQVFSGSSEDKRALILINEAYQTSRPFDARVTEIKYAPFISTRGVSADGDANKNKLNEAELLLLNKANNSPSAENLHNLGRIYLLKKQYDEAITEFEKARKLAPQESALLTDLATAYLEKGKSLNDKGQQLTVLNRALELYEESLKLNPQNREAAFNKALTFESLNLKQKERETWNEYLKIDSSSEWSQEARKKLESIGDGKISGKSREEIISDFMQAFEKRDEENAYRIAAANREMITNKLIPQQLVFLFLEQPDANGEYLAALKFFGNIERRKSGDVLPLRLAEFYEKIRREDLAKMQSAKQFIKKGYELCAAGKDDEALTQFEQAKNLYLAVGNRAEAGISDYWIGYCLARIGKSAESKKTLNSLADSSAQNGFIWLESHANVWLSYNAINEYALNDATKYNEKAVESAEKLSDLYNLQKTLAQRALIYYQAKDYRKAAEYYGKSLAVAAAPEASQREKWRGYDSLAYLFFATKQFYSAEAYQSEALQLALRLNDPSFIASSYKNLGIILGYSGKPQEAAQMFEQSRQTTARFPNATLKSRIFAELDLHSANILRINDKCAEASDLYKNSIDFYSAKDFEVDLYEAKKGQLLCFFAENKNDLFEQKLAEVLELFRNYRAKILDEQNRNSFFDGEQDVYDIAVNYSVRKNDFEAAFNFSEESRTRSLLDLQNSLGKVSTSAENPAVRFTRESVEPLNLTEIQQKLPDKVQIVQYTVLPDKVLLWLIQKNSFIAKSFEISSTELNEKIEDYKKSLTDGSENDQTLKKEISQQLYKILISPLESDLAKDKAICFIPDKSIFRVPLNALISETDGKFLIEKFSIFTAPSANILVNNSIKAKSLSAADTASEMILAIGNPAFDQEKYPNLAPLPAAVREAEKVAELYAKSTILLKENATKENIEKALTQSNVAHFAGHYLVDESNPLLSGLLTANKNSAENSQNVLASFEIISRPLPKTKMIILSACESGVENYYQGEGMIGGARAYLAAGVPLVLASYWNVDSEATAELMILFHQNRKQNSLSSVEALRQAQLGMIHNADPRYKNPYYWTAFSLIGGYSSY